MLKVFLNPISLFVTFLVGVMAVVMLMPHSPLNIPQSVPTSDFTIYSGTTVTLTSVDQTTFSDISINEIRIIEVVSGHAWQNHGAEVTAAIRCLSNNGTWKSFRTNGFTDIGGKNVPTNLWMCQDGDKFYAIVTTIFEKIHANFSEPAYSARLVTAYLISKDVFPTVNDFIQLITDKWGAREIAYAIQAGEQILLQPK